MSFGRFNRNGTSYAVSSLTPIRSGREDALREHLRTLAVSPFADLPDVHVARWLLIDQMKLQWPGAPKRKTRLRSQYLLFSASVTAADPQSAQQLPRSFLAAIATTIPRQADAVWGNCVNYPGAARVEEFVSYLERSLLDTLLFHAGYPATVTEVRRALALRDGFARFAMANQAVSDPAQLRENFITESAPWNR